MSFIQSANDQTNNEKIIKVLREQVDEYKVDKSMRWKTRALYKAIKAISEYDGHIISGDEAVKNISGIGKGIGKRIDEILKTGTLNELGKKKLYLDQLNELKTITGVGDTRAKKWIKQGIVSVADVRKAIATEKTTSTHHIDIGLKYYDDLKLRIPRNEVATMSKVIKETLKSIDPNLIFDVCGSYRRGRDSCGDIDVLFSNPMMKKIASKKYLSKVVAKLKSIGFICDSLTEKGEKKYMGVCRLADSMPARRIDIRAFDIGSYYAGLLYFTGSKNFNVIVRQKAIDLGYSLNEYGLTNTETKKKVELKSEEELFKLLDIPYLKPTDRDI